MEIPKKYHHLNFFLAVLFEQSEKEKFIAYRIQAPKTLLRRTTCSDNLHLTVGFMGSIDWRDLRAVKDCFMSLKSLESFALPSSGLGLFGKGRNLHDYLALSFEVSDAYLNLFETSSQLLEQHLPYRFRKNNPLRPHVTLQLVRHKLPQDTKEEIRQQFLGQKRASFSIQVKRLGLMYRNLALRRYFCVQEYPLA